MADDLTWWVRDAANSICGQTGAKAHQDKLHEAADELERLRAEVQTAFDKGYRAAGGAITPIISSLT